MKSTKLFNLFYNSIINSGRISNPARVFGERDLEVLFQLIEDVNELPEDTQIFKSVSLSEILVPKVLAPLVAPRSVRLVSGDLRFRNLKQRQGILWHSETKIDYNLIDVTSALDKLRQIVRGGNIGEMPITSFRIDYSLADVIDRVVVKRDDEYLISNKCVDEILPLIEIEDNDLVENYVYTQCFEDHFSRYYTKCACAGAFVEVK